MYDCLWNDAIVLLSLCDTRQHPKIVDLIIIKYKIYSYIYSIYSVSTNYLSTCYESPGSVKSCLCYTYNTVNIGYIE